MKRKTLLGISLLLLTGVVFCLIWHDSSFADDPPPVSRTTIIFTDDDGIRVSTNTDTVTKYKYCSMSDHPGNSSCGTNTPSDHPITTSWDPSDRKVTITIADDVVGFGQSKASITAGSALVNGETIEIQNLGGTVYNLGNWDDPNDILRVEYTANFKAFFYSPEDADPKSYTWNISSKIEIWGVDWEGSGTVTIGNSVGASFGLSPSGTYTVSTSSSQTVSSDISGNASDSFRYPSGPWVVAHDAVCGHVQCWKSLTEPHAHHWWCPSDNGCGYHIVCKDYIPDKHDLHATCWNEAHGCSETNVRKCTHECPFSPSTCNMCDEEVDPEQRHYKRCGSEVPGATSGCGDLHWTCKSSSHTVLMCGRFTNSWGTEILCGEMYRECSNNSFPYGECSYYRAHINGVEVCDDGCFGSSCSGCDP